MIDSSLKPQAYEVEEGAPLEKLSPRAFERLLYCINNEKIKQDLLSGFADKIELMQGVGERGRDCLFKKEGDVVGLIQCKHTVTREPFAYRILSYKNSWFVLLDVTNSLQLFI